jgi:hypothetical protein
MRVHFAIALVVTVAGLASPATAQTMLDPSNLPQLVPVTGFGESSAPPANDNLLINQSAVSIIDSALPRSTLRLRLDLGYDMPQPMRAEYFMSKNGLPLRETKIQSYQDLAGYVELAPLPFFSLFVEAPMRWLNPEVNANTYGIGDTNFGFKLATWNDPQLLATLQMRFYAPTGQPGLGTQHWTVEPALLGIWQPFTNLAMEGELRYWAPLGGTSFAGDVLRYGVGLSIGQATQSMWFKPVAEIVGWTALGGQTLMVTAPDAYMVQSAAGQTIVNGYLGLRLGLGNIFDSYIGYGRCFTGDSWTRDFVRVEVRLFY